MTMRSYTHLVSTCFRDREEEQEAARAYAEFVDAFDADGASRNKRGAFVRAGGHEEVYTPTLRDAKDRDEHMERVWTVVSYPVLLGGLTHMNSPVVYTFSGSCCSTPQRQG